MYTIRLNRENKTIKVVASGKNKTIKVVNRRKNLRLQHTGKTGPQGDQGNQGQQGTSLIWQGEWNAGANYFANATQTDVVFYEGSSYIALEGNVGQEPPFNATSWDLMVDKGDTGVSTFVRVHHNTDPNVARPSALYVEWVGSVAPNNATTEDTWIDTSL